MNDERPQKPRTAMVALRMPWLYGERSTKCQPGTTGLCDRGQIKAMIEAVKEGRIKRRVTLTQADIELRELRKGLDIIDKGPHRDVGVYFPINDCFPPPDGKQGRERRRAKAARRARKAQRRRQRR